MKIIAQVCWFDEPLHHFERLIASLEGVVDAAVFLDGAYARFPHRDPTSRIDQDLAIRDLCEKHHIECLIPEYHGAWQNQTVKRTAMWNYAAKLGTPHRDYTLVIDADEHVEHVDAAQLRSILSKWSPDACQVALETPAPNGWIPSSKGIQSPRNSTSRHGRAIPRLFRLFPEIQIGPKYHGTYCARNKRGHLMCLKDRRKEYAHLSVKARIIDVRHLLQISNGTWSRDRKRIASKHHYGIVREAVKEDL